MTLLVVILIVFAALWLGTRKRRAGPSVRVTVRERVETPSVASREPDPVVTIAAPRLAPRPTPPTNRAASVPRATILATRAVSPPVARAGRRSSARSPELGYMLRRRGLCSPDPHP